MDRGRALGICEQALSASTADQTEVLLVAGRS